MIDFDTFIKIAKECGRFGQIICCQILYKIAQSPINRPTVGNLTERHFLELLTKKFVTCSRTEDHTDTNC